MLSPETQLREHQDLSKLNEMLAFCGVIIPSALFKQVIYQNYLCSIIFKLVPRKRRKRKTGAHKRNIDLRLDYDLIILLINSTEQKNITIQSFNYKN